LNKKTPKIKSAAPIGASFVVVSSFFYASYGIWTKLMGDFFGGYTASALRSILVLLLLVPIAFAYRQLCAIDWRKNWRYFVGMVVASAFVWGPLYFAILEAGVGISLAITYAGIVSGMFIFGWLFAGERITRSKWTSIALGLVGLWLVFSPSIAAGFGWLALVAALVSGLGSAANSVIAKKMPYNATQATVFLWIASVVANIPMAFLLQEHAPSVGWHIQWFYLVLFAVASIIASWAFIKGVKLIEAGAAGVIGLLEIVFGVLFGVIFFSERPGLVVLSGVAIIIVAAAIPYIKDYNARRGTLEES
jgi:drug/metabolite transporter (DMT)-like permease